MNSRLNLLLFVLTAVVAVLYFVQDRDEPQAESNEDGVAEEILAPERAEPAQELTEEQLAAWAESGEIAVMETEFFRAEFSTLNTGLVHFKLKQERFAVEGEPLDLVSVNRPEYYGFQLNLPGIPFDPLGQWEILRESPGEVVFRRQENGFTVVRRLAVSNHSPYQIWSTLRISNRSGETVVYRPTFKTFHYVARDAEEAGFIGVPSTAQAYGVCDVNESVERFTTEDLVEDAIGFGGNTIFAAINDMYFAQAMASDEPAASRCVLTAERRGGSLTDESWMGSLLSAELRYPRAEVGSGDDVILRSFVYIGPTDRAALHAAGHHMPEIVDLGWFGAIANVFSDVLSFLYGLVGNWGLAIILLTILVKLLFFPITKRSYESMGKMRKLKPKIDEINERLADDPNAKGAAMMKLYKDEGVNPVSGCLPMILQMPVWFALYRSLMTNVELYNAPFVWIWQDLSAQDPYFILPILVAVMMHMQQRLTPNTLDSQQAKIMMWLMPIMIGSFMLFLPAGLCLYMVTNSILTISQQHIIYRSMDNDGAENTKTGSADTKSSLPSTD